MLLRLILVELNTRRAAILGWGIGLGLYAALILSIVPQLGEQFSRLDLGNIPAYQAFGITDSIGSAVDLLAIYTPFFGLLVAVYGAMTGTNTLAGEEDRGTLEMMLTMPIRRWVLVLAKVIAIEVSLLLIALLLFAGFAVVFPAVQPELGDAVALSDLFAVSLEVWPLAFFFAMLGLFMGSWMPRRSYALGATLLVLIGSYLFNNIAGTVDALDSLRPLLPFYYYRGGDIIARGVDWLRVLTLVIAGLVCCVLAMAAFQRRNVTTGAWPWQRADVRMISAE